MKRIAGLLSLSVLFAGCSTTPMFSQDGSSPSATVERMARLQGCDPYKGANQVAGTSGQDYQVQCANGQQLTGHCEGNDCSVHIASSGAVAAPVARATVQANDGAPLQANNGTPTVVTAQNLQYAGDGQAVRAVPSNPLKFVISLGVTGGGDPIETVTYTNNTTKTIDAGTGVQTGLGVDYRVSPEVALQATVNFQAGAAAASNADVLFERFPFEFLGYYYLNDSWRFGGGARFVEQIRLVPSGSLNQSTIDYGNAVGAALEAEYFFTSHLSVKLRAVKESYKLPASSLYPEHTFNANQVGVFVNGYF